MPEIRFVSFASSNMRPSLDRIRREARASGFFDTIHTYTEHDLEPWYRRQYADRFRRYKRGYGYWIWKSHIIKNELDSLKPDDILVYLDAGCTINGEGYNRFRQYVDYTRRTDVGIVAFQQKRLLEKHWTRADLLAHCGALDDSSITDSGQLLSGAHLTRKTQLAEEFVGRWHDLCHNHFNLITDEPSALPNLPGFEENRHDQSAYSVLLKPYGPYIVDSDETYSYTDDYARDLPDKPFWATRRRQLTWWALKKDGLARRWNNLTTRLHGSSL